MSKLAKLTLIISFSILAQGQDWKLAIQAKLLSRYTLTKITGDRRPAIVTAGSAVVLKKDSLGMRSTQAWPLPYLSPTPGAERVIAVSMTRSFTKPALVQAVIDAARKKYAMNLTADQDELGAAARVLSWRFGSKDDRLIPKTSTDFARAVLGLPGQASPRNGVGLDVSIVRGNAPIAMAYGVSLFRESDLAKFQTQIDGVMAGFAEQRKNDEIEKAKQSAPIRF